MEEAPDPKEVSSFHFVQLRTLKLVKQNEQAPRDFINVIASASKFGLLFVGIANGFKVLKLENVLDLDEDKENKSIEENYFSQIVSCESPLLLSLSTDQKTLAVGVERNLKAMIDFYDIAAFADSEGSPVPFQNIQLSSNNCRLKEFIWNPVSDGIFAYCLDDGSLGVQELNGMNLSVLANMPNVGATAVCWSPKGKQLVVGKKDGSFSQYKPNLQEVKNIPAPNMNEKLMVANICWLSTTQFAVLYMPPGSGVSPYLFIVSTPKGSPVAYTNFYDICLGNSTDDSQRYFLHHESAWNILICASTDSIEVAVIGDPPSWVQWDLREDGRILLPAKNGARCTIGAGVMYCAQRRIVISENESYPPMPIIFLLTDNGLLVSYHMVNTSPGCISLVRPSTPIDRTGERKKAGGTQIIGNTLASPHSMLSVSKIPEPNVISTPSFVQSPTLENMNATVLNRGSMAFGLSPANPQRSFQPPPPPPQIVNITSMAPAPVPSSSIQFGAPSPNNVSNEMERFHKPSKGVTFITPTQTTARDSSGVRHMAVAQRSALDARMTKDSLHGQDTYRTAIVEEMQTFEKDILELKKSSEQLGIIGTKEEMGQLKSFTLNFEEFNDDMSETMVSLNNDIHSLKNILLESFVLVEQAHSKERRKNDHSYISMLRERALDPLTAKRMQKIEQHYLYLSTQLQEVNNKLDQDWFEYLEKKKASQRSVRHLSSAEAMYKTVVNNQKIIHNLRQIINLMTNQLVEKRLQSLSKRKNKAEFIKRTGPEELSKLADAFLQAKLINSEEDKPQLPKKIPLSAQNALKNYLSNSPITVVRPTIVSSPAQSRLLSKSLLYKESLLSPSNETDTALNATSLGSDKLRQMPDSTFGRARKEEQLMGNLTKSGSKANSSTFQFSSSKLSSSPNSAEEIPSPIYEDITPPDSPGALKNNDVHVLPTAGNETLHISFDQGVPKLMSTIDNKSLEMSLNQGIQRAMSGDSGLQMKALSEHPKDLQDISQQMAKHAQSFFQTENKPLSFTVLSSANAKLASGDQLSTIKVSPNNASQFGKAEEKQSANQMIKPNTVKPTASFSLFPTSSPVSSFATPSSKHEGNITVGSLSQSPQHAIDMSNQQSSKPPATLFTGSLNLERKEGSNELEKSSSSNLLCSGAVSEKSKTSNFSQQPTSFIPTVATKASSFFKMTTPKTVSTPFTFFEPSPGVTAISQSALSSNSIKTSPSCLAITSVFSQNVTTQATTMQLPKTVEVLKSETSPIISSSISSVGSPSAFSQAPLNFTQKSLPTEEKTIVSSTGSGVNVSASTAVTQAAVQSSFFSSKPPITSVLTQGTTSLSSASSTSQPSSAPTLSATQLTFKQPTSPVATSEPDQAINSNSGSNLSATTSQTASTTSVFVVASTTSQTTNMSSVFPATVITSQTTSASSVFSGVSTTSKTSTTSVFSVASTASVTTAVSSVFTVTSTTSQPPPMFGQANSSIFSPSPNVVISTATATTPATQSVFGQPNSTSSSFFGQTPTSQSTFGQTVTTQSSFFGKATSETPAFGQVSPFGATQTNSFTQSSGSFFAPTSTGQASVFGSNTSGNSGFGNQSAASNFSFGKSAFGETQGSFGLAKSVFGQQNSSGFGATVSSPSSTTFGQSPENTVFGQGSFFSGLGGQPSAENANKNVFAMGNLGKPNSEPGNVFGGAAAFGSKVNAGSSFGNGNFTSGGSSVAQTGFGSFHQSPQKPGGFGAAPAFGAAPGFGSPPAFGSAPAFGSGSPLGNVFGAQSGGQTASFSNFASANTPTFGSLASQNTGGFGQQQASPFGGGGSVFGGASFGGSPGFGGSSAPSNNSSAFTQWRS